MQETNAADLYHLEILVGPVRLCWNKPVQTVKPMCGIPSLPFLDLELLRVFYLAPISWLCPLFSPSSQLPHGHWQEQDESGYYMCPLMTYWIYQHR